MTDYSQKGEQHIILEYFNDFTGTFLDIGANDGKTFSNTYALALNGWSGVAVEPTKGAYDALYTLHANNKVHTINCAVGSENKIIDLYEGSDSLVSTAVKEEKEKWSKAVKFHTVSCAMVTYERLMEMADYKKFDLISIDTEGLDYDILKQIDLTDVKMLIVEVNERARQQYIDYCAGFGLGLIKDNNLNLIFAR